MKDCSACGKRLPLDEFYKNVSATDGLTSRCKTCLSEYQRKRRERENASKPPGWKQKTKDIVAYRKAWKAAHPGYATAKKREWWQRNKDRLRVKEAVRYALKTGKLVRQPCSVCATTERVEAHHPDYTKPLEVVWVCRKHHNEIHHA